MKKIIYTLLIAVAGFQISCQSTAQNEDAGTFENNEWQGYLRPVRAGVPDKRPFWNINAQRFIYAPAFDFMEVQGAVKYKFDITGSDDKSYSFAAEKPWAPLSPIWADVPEGYTTLTVLGLNASGEVMDTSAVRTFYRSPGFTAKLEKPALSYEEASRSGLKAIYEVPEVQYWLENGKPHPGYKFYSYPNKLIGALVRAMTTYSQVALEQEDREAALKIARKMADYLLSVPLSEGPYAGIPPAYLNNVDKPTGAALRNLEQNWFMVMSATDAGFGFLDIYDATKDERYFDMAIKIADKFVENQQEDGTWHHMINYKTGVPISPQRLNPTWIIFYYDRLAKQYELDNYRESRKKAWKYIVNNPLKTYRWDAQFEDVKLRDPYMNMSREQACDVALLLLQEAKENPQGIDHAEELLRYAEDQFVVWAPVKDCEGWRKAMPDRRKNCDKWIANVVLEQYACYDPVARSSGILINTYIKAHEVTGKTIYLQKAKALANGLLEGQAWHAKHQNANGEIPTWVMRSDWLNWLNNSYYAAEAVLTMAEFEERL
jgi:hypothetical protein